MSRVEFLIYLDTIDDFFRVDGRRSSQREGSNASQLVDFAQTSMTLSLISNIAWQLELLLISLPDSHNLQYRPDTSSAEVLGGEGAKMSLIYPAGGALGALGVVGLCQSTIGACACASLI